MSMYLIPPSLRDEIQQIMNSFFWRNSQGQNKGINWMEWDKLTISKKHGGMGFQNIYAFNLAMLTKQAWKYVQHPEALVCRVFSARYFSNGDFREAPIGHSLSYTWRSL